MFALSMRSRAVLAAVITVAVAGGASVRALAQSAETKAAPAAAAKPAAGVPVLVVIDAERIRRESLAGRSINVEAEKYSNKINEEDRRDEAPLRAAEQDLQKLRGTLSPEQFAVKARAFEQRVANVQRTELGRHQAFDRSLNAATYKWQQAMLEAAHEVAQAHNADAMLQRQALVFYNTSWDVTNEVIDLMNKRVAKIDFPPPKIELDQPGTTGPASPSAGVPGKPLSPGQPQPQLKLPAQ